MSSLESVNAFNNQVPDVEKQTPPVDKHHQGRVVSLLRVEDGEVYQPHPEKNPKWYQRLLDVGVEENGIRPVPVEKRTNTQYFNLFTVLFTALMCLLP